MSYLKQSTTVTVKVGPFLDATDGVTEETGLTPAIELSKAGGAFASRNSATAVSHDAEGWYGVELDSTDTATLGRLVLKAQDSANHLPVWHEFTVLPANVYDSVVAGTDNLQVDTTQVEGNDATDQIRDAVLDDATRFSGADIAAILTDTAEIGAAGAGLTEAGGTGDQLTAVPWNVAWDSEVESEVTDALNTYDPPTHAELISEVNDVQTDITALNDPTAAAIADAVWDEAKSGHVSAGSFGEEVQAHALSSEISALNDPSAADIADAVWDESTTGHTTSGTFGEQVKTDVDAILADTNEMQGDWTDGGRLDLLVDAILADTGTDIPALIAALNDLSAADVNAQVLDVLNTDTFAEPSGTPGATITLAAKIGYLYMALRNQVTVTSSAKTFYDDSGTSEWKKSLTDDGTTYTEAEASAP